VQPTYAQSTTVPGTRARKPTLDEMGSAVNRPIPARAPQVDPRTNAGAFGERVRGPHKPTLDEMGPHAERGLPVAGKPLPPKPTVRPPTRTIEMPDEAEKKKHRHGRPKKTGRPGQ
jgi:excinuclease ABC subunit B